MQGGKRYRPRALVWTSENRDTLLIVFGLRLFSVLAVLGLGLGSMIAGALFSVVATSFVNVIGMMFGVGLLSVVTWASVVILLQSADDISRHNL